ncbi:MAG: pseudouridine-5'-phosphate glycosidase [Pyrinomonadaceae bacterium]|nr:pseudouridine-5'-phosphate glycosidase [Pyrinomonadaceae bacterium]MCX7639467.1 pseudouridine-5'-phosphate glycosidase [Pyrinomonadaceae bacterium]MDW8304482.1 pseudouridine-5'-phosphate glycosidase [Acidobacteriota bacterium]
MIKASEEVKQAIADKYPIVALESTVIAHGLPFPLNLETALEMEQIVRNMGVVPATIAILKGEIRVGLTEREIEYLASNENIKKVSMHNLPTAIAKKLDGATTVASTSFIANRLGIEVLATGGIGGIHREYTFDISGDLPVLAKTPITVVCAGAKSILDLRATREWLETYGITTIGYKCNYFPVFYSSRSDLEVDASVNSIEEIIEIIKIKRNLELKTATLVTVPLPDEFELQREELEKAIKNATEQANEKGIKGKSLTPFLLKKLAELTKGKTLKANTELLKNNVRVACEIATHK